MELIQHFHFFIFGGQLTWTPYIHHWQRARQSMEHVVNWRFQVQLFKLLYLRNQAVYFVETCIACIK